MVLVSRQLQTVVTSVWIYRIYRENHKIAYVILNM